MEIVAAKVDAKWVQFNLLEGERLSYQESSLLLKMINRDGKVVTRYLTPADEWGVLRRIDYLLDLGELDTKVPNSKQQGYMLSTDCDVCNDGTIKLFAEEVQHLFEKLPFPCLHAGLINLFRLNPAGEGTVFPTPRQGFPLLPDREN